MASRKSSDAKDLQRKRLADLAASNLQLRRLTHPALAAQENERMKTSRELRDEIARAK